VGWTPLRIRRVRTFFLTGGGGEVSVVVVVVAVSAKSRVDDATTALPMPLSCRWMAGAKDRHGRVRRLAVIIVIVGEIFIGCFVRCQGEYCSRILFVF